MLLCHRVEPTIVLISLQNEWETSGMCDISLHLNLCSQEWNKPRSTFQKWAIFQRSGGEIANWCWVGSMVINGYYDRNLLRIIQDQVDFPGWIRRTRTRAGTEVKGGPCPQPVQNWISWFEVMLVIPTAWDVRSTTLTPGMNGLDLTWT